MKSILSIKVIILLAANFFCTSNLIAQDTVKAQCQASFYNDTLLQIHLKIFNPIRDSTPDDRNYLTNIYIPISEWWITGSKNSNFIVPPPMPTELIVNSIVYYPKNYENWEFYTTGDPVYEIMYNLKFLPKIVELWEGDSVEFIINYHPNKDKMLIDSIGYQIDMYLPYSTLSDFNEVELIIRNFRDLIENDHTYSFDITNRLYHPTKKKWQYFTKRKLSRCEIQLLKFMFKNHNIHCRCDIKREE